MSGVRDATPEERAKALGELQDQMFEFEQDTKGRILIVESRLGQVYGPFPTWGDGVAWATERYGKKGGFYVAVLRTPEEWRAV